MGKVDVYIGGYLLIDEVTKEESERLASNACIVGMPVSITYNAETSEFKAVLPNGDSVGTVHPKNRLAIREALEEGWTAAGWLSLVYYDNEAKLFRGEMVYQMFHVKPSQTTEQANLEAFTRKTAERLAAGKRPDVVLTGEGWDTVIETGDWESDKQESLPIDTKRNSGLVVFKRKRSVSDKLALAAMSKNPGCHIALVVCIIILALIVLFFVWKCTSGA